VEINGKGEGSIASSGYGSQNQIGAHGEDPQRNAVSAPKNTSCSGIYGTTGGTRIEGDSSTTGSISSARAKLSTDDFRMELQSMINSMNSISESFSEPNYFNGRQQQYSPPGNMNQRQSNGGDPLYDIPEASRFREERESASEGRQLSFSSSRSESGRNSSPGELTSRLSNGSGIAYLLQNRHRSLHSSSSCDYSSISSSDLMNHNNSRTIFGNHDETDGGGGGGGPDSLPLNTATIHRHYANPQIPVLNGSSLFSGNSNNNGAGVVGSGSNNTNQNHFMGLNRNNSLPRPHSIAAPQQSSSFMSYRFSAKKRDFV
jgi:hypothetical protein